MISSPMKSQLSLSDSSSGDSGSSPCDSHDSAPQDFEMQADSVAEPPNFQQMMEMRKSLLEQDVVND